MCHSSVAGAAAWLTLSFALAEAGAQTFTILRPLGAATNCGATAVSPDGRFITGLSYGASIDSTATVWDNDGVPSGLTSYSPYDSGRAVSNDGTRVGGIAGALGAIVWDTGPGGDLLLGGPGDVAALSFDGEVAVGTRGPTAAYLGFVHRRGMSPALIDLPPSGLDTRSLAIGVNRPGTLAVGYASHYEQVGEDVFYHASVYVWPVAGGQPTILANPPLALVGEGFDISDDGRVIVGNSSCCPDGLSRRATRWVDGVAEVIDRYGGFSSAYGVSGDGRVVVGGGYLDAYIWDRDHGLRSITEILLDAGVDLSNLAIYSADDISQDGTVIVGTGEDFARGVQFGWRLVLPRCRADLNGDGLVDFADYLEFLNYYDTQDPRADFNMDGLVDFGDYLEFLNHYDAGC
ncbi:MAG: hypothetical protein IT436_13255 [Phycisphaerales bacterium]|nr:hypothetical protein [Phycisphaerales bacterium]